MYLWTRDGGRPRSRYSFVWHMGYGNMRRRPAVGSADETLIRRDRALYVYSLTSLVHSGPSVRVSAYIPGQSIHPLPLSARSPSAPPRAGAAAANPRAAASSLSCSAPHHASGPGHSHGSYEQGSAPLASGFTPEHASLHSAYLPPGPAYHTYSGTPVLESLSCSTLPGSRGSAQARPCGTQTAQGPSASLTIQITRLHTLWTLH